MIKNKEPFEGYIFTKITRGGTKVTFRIDTLDITHTELTYQFTNFLRASGFIFDARAELVLLREDNEIK